MTLADSIKELRAKDGRSLQQVADAVGISKAHVWDLERGSSTNPTLEVLTGFANCFRVSISYLIGEDGEEDTDLELVALYRGVKSLGPRDRDLVFALVEKMLQNGRQDIAAGPVE